jgi:hypothetical protein
VTRNTSHVRANAALLASAITNPDWRERLAATTRSEDLLATAYDYLRAALTSGLTSDQRTHARIRAAAALIQIAEDLNP